MKIKEKRIQAYVIRTEDNAYFEEAHFLLKKELPPERESEMVVEANRILAMQSAAMLLSQKEKRKKGVRSPFWFYFAGVGTALALFLFFALTQRMLG